MAGSGKKIKRELDCVLSHEECGELGIKASKNRTAALAHRDSAKELDKEAKVWEEAVTTGKVKRQVECIEVKDFTRSEIRVERCDESSNWPDGNKVVEERAMTGDERQMMMDNPDDDDGEEEAPAKTTVKAPAKRGRKSN